MAEGFKLFGFEITRAKDNKNINNSQINNYASTS